jgi:hypothetical protein
VTVVARDASRVLLDTSVFVNFAEGGMLIPLSQYLGGRAAIALDVHVELKRLAGTRHAELVTLGRLRWPAGSPVELPTYLLADAEDLRKLHAPAGAHERANRGEIATTLLAHRLGAVAIIDDELGKRLCSFRGVPRLSTAQLAAEMVAAGALDEESRFAVFDAATPAQVGRAEFQDALARARQALG